MQIRHSLITHRILIKYNNIMDLSKLSFKKLIGVKNIFLFELFSSNFTPKTIQLKGYLFNCFSKKLFSLKKHVLFREPSEDSKSHTFLEDYLLREFSDGCEIGNSQNSTTVFTYLKANDSALSSFLRYCTLKVQLLFYQLFG